MPGPTIIITQNSSITTGVPNLNVVTGTSVTFSLTSSYASYQWVLVSAPVNSSLVPSSATLSGATTNTATIIPDIRGTYKVRFIANNGVGLNLISELWFYARNLSDAAPFNQLIPTNSSALPRRHPAYTEGAESGSRGVATELDAWMYLVEQLQSGGGGGANTTWIQPEPSGTVHLTRAPAIFLKFGNFDIGSVTLNTDLPPVDGDELTISAHLLDGNWTLDAGVGFFLENPTSSPGSGCSQTITFSTAIHARWKFMAVSTHYSGQAVWVVISS